MLASLTWVFLVPKQQQYQLSIFFEIRKLDFIRQKERNTRLVQLYLAAIASRTVTLDRNCALYCIAVHQISTFIYNLEMAEQLREQILALVLNAANDIRDDILLFDGISKTAPHIVRKQKIPDGPERWVESVKSKRKI